MGIGECVLSSIQSNIGSMDELVSTLIHQNRKIIINLLNCILNLNKYFLPHTLNNTVTYINR